MVSYLEVVSTRSVGRVVKSNQIQKTQNRLDRNVLNKTINRLDNQMNKWVFLNRYSAKKKRISKIIQSSSCKDLNIRQNHRGSLK